MNKEARQFQIIENVPTVTDYAFLRSAVSWYSCSHEHISQALHGSLYCICVYESGNIIGMGRIVGDSCLCFYIQDVMVVPSKQRKGVGGIIMSHIMSYIRDHAAEGAYIGLMCSKGKTHFYKRYGFVSRPNSTMGPGIVIRNYRPDHSPL